MDELYDDHENVLPRKHARLRILLPCFDTWGCGVCASTGQQHPVNKCVLTQYQILFLGD